MVKIYRLLLSMVFFEFYSEKKAMENAETIYNTIIKDKRVYFQSYGIERKDTIKKTLTVALI